MVTKQLRGDKPGMGWGKGRDEKNPLGEIRIYSKGYASDRIGINPARAEVPQAKNPENASNYATWPLAR